MGKAILAARGQRFKNPSGALLQQFCCLNPAFARNKWMSFRQPTNLQIATVTMVVAQRTVPETETPMFRQNLS